MTFLDFVSWTAGVLVVGVVMRPPMLALEGFIAGTNGA